MSQYYLISGNLALPLQEISVAEMDHLWEKTRYVYGYPTHISADGRIWPIPGMRGGMEITVRVSVTDGKIA